MPYFFIHNTEDGLAIKTVDNIFAANAEIAELTSEDILPEYRAKFRSDLPKEISEPDSYCIIQGEIVKPRAVETVVEFKL